MDQSIAIQETLAEDENCIIAVQCFILVNNATESRLLGLVERSKEHALFVYAHCRMAITGDDVSLDGIIPISYDFAVVEVSSPDELAVVGADTRLRVTFLSEELELRLPFGSHTRLFLSEVNKAWSDVCQQYPAAAPRFEWLAKYRRKVTATRGSLKQSLSLVEPLSKLGHNKKTERS
ncbi:type II inositol 1,4,5-trisphosphate 5-phosphatase-like isoform X2 [Alosa sapidissima]|uniref:type II inositol 1,4,5-trisphosphate 5-phosphatase-like isoform X2 n=1 Tax=Alosa sapidissima TaxID=34773 RepID=UPI001C0A5FE5|nr:type II inositol 1,4,5-trisphosphate 5-phosphatase-like isoform X2 [Alosa sapidissima]